MPATPEVYARPVALPPVATFVVVTQPVLIEEFVQALTVKSWPTGPLEDDALTESEPATVPYVAVGAAGVASCVVASVGPNGAVVAARYPLEAVAVSVT